MLPDAVPAFEPAWRWGLSGNLATLSFCPFFWSREIAGNRAKLTALRIEGAATDTSEAGNAAAR